MIGCGYLGAVHAACMAELGHDVVGIDVDESKVEELAAARAPFYEPGLPELLRQRAGLRPAAVQLGHRPRRPGRCRASPPSTSSAWAPRRERTSTPPTLSYVDAAVTALLPHLRPGDLVVGKSTVPVGTAARLAERIAAAAPGAMLAWNPEFLREGHAVEDTLHPDRIVYGLPPDADQARAARGAARRGVRARRWPAAPR